MCGKNECIDNDQSVIVGSPPRVREKQLIDKKSPHLPGITPACAGKTLKDPIEITNPD